MRRLDDASPPPSDNVWRGAWNCAVSLATQFHGARHASQSCLNGNQAPGNDTWRQKRRHPHARDADALVLFQSVPRAFQVDLLPGRELFAHLIRSGRTSLHVLAEPILKSTCQVTTNWAFHIYSSPASAGPTKASTRSWFKSCLKSRSNSLAAPEANAPL
jgi:hypothetical protein